MISLLALLLGAFLPCTAQAKDKTGTITLGSFDVGQVHVERAEVRYSLGAFFGEPTKNGSFAYWGEKQLHYSTMAILACSSGANTYYITVEPTVESPGKGFGMNVCGSPSWDKFFRLSDNYGETNFLDAASAKAFCKHGFEVVSAKLVADPKGLEDQAKTFAREEKEKEVAAELRREEQERKSKALEQKEQPQTNNAGSGVQQRPGGITNSITVRPIIMHRQDAPNPFTRTDRRDSPQGQISGGNAGSGTRFSQQADPNPFVARSRNEQAASRLSEPTTPVPNSGPSKAATAPGTPKASPSNPFTQQRQRQEAIARLQAGDAEARRQNQNARAAHEAEQERKRAEIKRKADNLAEVFAEQNTQIEKTFEGIQKRNRDMFDEAARIRAKDDDRKREQAQEREREREWDEARGMNREQADRRDWDRQVRDQERRRAEDEAERKEKAWNDAMERIKQLPEEMRKSNNGTGSSNDDISDAVRRAFGR